LAGSTENVAVLAPIPSGRVRIAASVNTGLRHGKPPATMGSKIERIQQVHHVF